MADSHVERKSCQHGVELNGKTAAITELVGVCGLRGAERARHTPVTSTWNGFLCPRLGAKQRKRKYKERKYPLRHNRTSCCVVVNKSRWGKPGGQETEESNKGQLEGYRSPKGTPRCHRRRELICILSES